MKIKEDICSKCGRRQTVNKTKMLCIICNNKRLQEIKDNSTLNHIIEKEKIQKPIFDKPKIPKPNFEKEKITYNKQEKQKIQKLFTEKTSSVTEQQKKSILESKQLSELKNLITDENLKNGTYYCRGCGSQQEGLDRSHIIGIAQRPDLKLLKENIDLLCRYCHIKWESGNIIKQLQLNCFSDYLEFLKKHDNIKYQNLLNKLEEHGRINNH